MEHLEASHKIWWTDADGLMDPTCCHALARSNAPHTAVINFTSGGKGLARRQKKTLYSTIAQHTEMGNATIQIDVASLIMVIMSSDHMSCRNMSKLHETTIGSCNDKKDKTSIHRNISKLFMLAANFRVGFRSSEMPWILHLLSTLRGWSTWFSSSNKSLTTHFRAFKKRMQPKLNLSRCRTPTWPSGCLSWRVWRAFSHCFWRPRDTTCCVLSCEHWWAVRILGLGTNLKHILPDNRTQTANPFGLRMSRCCFRSHWRWSFGTEPQNRCSNRRCQSWYFWRG